MQKDKANFLESVAEQMELSDCNTADTSQLIADFGALLNAMCTSQPFGRDCFSLGVAVAARVGDLVTSDNAAESSTRIRALRPGTRHLLLERIDAHEGRRETLAPVARMMDAIETLDFIADLIRREPELPQVSGLHEKMRPVLIA